MTDFAQRVAIVGFGIAGAMTACLLQRAGIAVTIFESSSAEARQGAGLLLQAPALAALAHADLLAPIQQLGQPITQIVARFSPSKRQFELNYPADKRALGIQRAALLDVLRGSVSHDSASPVHWQTRITKTNAASGMLWCEQIEFGPFDLVIAADGANSQLRALCQSIHWTKREYSSAALVCLAEFTDDNVLGSLTQEFCANTHVSSWPVGASQPGGVRCTAIAVPICGQQLVKTDSETWLEILQNAAPGLAAKVQALPRLPSLLRYRYCDVQMQRCFDQRLVFLGDAAHAMSPQLGMGASLALLDAWHLAQAIRSAPVAEALANFQTSPLAQVTRLQRISRIVTPMLQSAQPLYSTLREPLFRMLASNRRLQEIAMDVLNPKHATTLHP